MVTYSSMGELSRPHAQELGRLRQLELTLKGTRLHRWVGKTFIKSTDSNRPDYGVPHGPVIIGSPGEIGWIGLGSWTLNSIISRNSSRHHINKVG